MFFLPSPVPNMLCVSIIFKAFTATCLLVTLFLMGFLLIGNLSTASAYSSVYMVKLSFNTSAEAFLELASNGSSAIGSRYITTNYMGMCGKLETGAKLCSTLTNSTNLGDYFAVSFQDSGISLIDIAHNFSDACHPRLLITSLVLVVLLIVALLWCAIPFLPSKPLVRKLSAGLCLVCILIWGLGLMLQHQTVAAAIKLVGASSMNMVIASKGARAEAMTWTAFAFLVVVLGLFSKDIFMDMRKAKPAKKEESAMPMQQPFYYDAQKKHTYV